MGAALTKWESVEYMMASLFGQLVGSDSLAGERVYGTIQSAKGRRDALEAAAQVTFFLGHAEKSIRDEFALLMSHYASAAPRRNDIAHGIVMRFRLGDVDRGCFLTPPHYSTLKHKKLSFEAMLSGGEGFDLMTHDYRYTVADIEHFIARFGELWGWAFEVYVSLQARQPGRQG